MIYKLQYKASVARDLRKIGKKEGRMLLEAVGDVIAKEADRGIRSGGVFKELSTYRIGNHRVVYTVLGAAVLVLRIGYTGEKRKDPDGTGL